MAYQIITIHLFVLALLNIKIRARHFAVGIVTLTCLVVAL